MNKRVAIYARVSTHHQIDKDSLPLQKQDLINYSTYILGKNDYEIFEDAGYSAKNTDRPAFQNMMTKIRNGEFSHLLVWKIDRISRNLLDFCDMYNELKSCNVTFVSKNEQFDTSTAMGEAMLKIILVFAELERKLTGERVTAVMIDRASKGLWNGAPVPLGYRWDNEKKFPIPDEEEKNTVEYIYNAYLKTNSTTAVKEALNTNGIKTKRDGTWTTKTISDIIRNPFYKGTYRYNYREPGRGKKKDEKEWIMLENNHQGIVPVDLWEKCNKIMDINAQKSNAAGFRSNGKVHVFAGILECGECHNNLYAKQDKPNMDGFIPSLYVCSGRYNRLGCEQKTISEKYVGTFVLSFISNLIRMHKKLNKVDAEELEKELLRGSIFKDVIGIEDIESLKAITSSSQKYSPKPLENENNSFALDVAKKEKAKYQRALERLEDLYLFDDEGMSEKDYILKKNKINEKLAEIDKRIKKMNTGDDLYDISLFKEISSFIVSKELLKVRNINYKELLSIIDRETLKDFMNTILDKIIIRDRKILSIRFKSGLTCNFVSR